MSERSLVRGIVPRTGGVPRSRDRRFGNRGLQREDGGEGSSAAPGHLRGRVTGLPQLSSFPAAIPSPGHGSVRARRRRLRTRGYAARIGSGIGHAFRSSRSTMDERLMGLGQEDVVVDPVRRASKVMLVRPIRSTRMNTSSEVVEPRRRVVLDVQGAQHEVALEVRVPHMSGGSTRPERRRSRGSIGRSRYIVYAAIDGSAVRSPALPHTFRDGKKLAMRLRPTRIDAAGVFLLGALLGVPGCRSKAAPAASFDSARPLSGTLTSGDPAALQQDDGQWVMPAKNYASPVQRPERRSTPATSRSSASPGPSRPAPSPATKPRRSSSATRCTSSRRFRTSSTRST